MTASFRFGDLLAQVGDVEENAVLPPDEYTVVVEEAEAVIAQSSGNPMLKVKFSVVGGPHNGRWLWNNFVLAINSTKGADALKPFFRQMTAFGLDADFFNNLGDQGLEAVAPLLVGKQVNVKTGTREYQGKTYVDVKSISKASAAAGAPGIPQVPTPGVPAPAPAAVPTPQVPAATAPATAPAAPAPVTPPAPAAPPVPGPPAAAPPPPF